ncbi:hypothetical protein HNR44_003247 [Geomicrobium halophilum]|uniref:DinB-like domain-containing protein n=1 Tax=Geomicrobium halophilum TaxID=549000 RepID=A0A841Q0K0_9BACL|nr:DinB family protein [Geomicrobium halophilum]MBB6451253.1 hypothetical protein [Geomicrobium halophilum]
MTDERDLWNQVIFVRKATLFEVKELTEADADRIPNGYNNSIRWNLGHIGTIQAMLVNGYSSHRVELPARYEKFFARGTSPADWEEAPPTLDEIRFFMRNQTDQLQTVLSSHLDEPLKEPFPIGKAQIETVGELLRFSLYHEGLHTGVFKGIKKTIHSSEK